MHPAMIEKREKMPDGRLLSQQLFAAEPGRWTAWFSSGGAAIHAIPSGGLSADGEPFCDFWL